MNWVELYKAKFQLVRSVKLAIRSNTANSKWVGHGRQIERLLINDQCELFRVSLSHSVLQVWAHSGLHTQTHSKINDGKVGRRVVLNCWSSLYGSWSSYNGQYTFTCSVYQSSAPRARYQRRNTSEATCDACQQQVINTGPHKHQVCAHYLRRQSRTEISENRNR